MFDIGHTTTFLTTDSDTHPFHADPDTGFDTFADPVPDPEFEISADQHPHPDPEFNFFQKLVF